MAPQPGTVLGAYEIVGLLGAGGMGEVYRARDMRLGRDVAIKIIPAALSTDPERVQRFEQEARAAAALNHPNILSVFDVGVHESSPFIVSELLEGETLRERLSTGPLAVRKAIDYGIQIAQALAAAHEKGIIHRDLKPENIFINKDGRAKVLDFGLAKLKEVDAPLIAGTNLPTSPAAHQTHAGVVLGTAGYMAPEQVRGQPVDERADVFAFGAVLYEMLGGRRAFEGDTTIDTMTAILKDDPADLPIAERHIPPPLARIVDRCLEKNPALRFHSMHDLALALETLSAGSASAIATTLPVALPGRRRVMPWAIAAVASAAAIATGAWTYFRPVPAAATYRATLLPPEGVQMLDPAPSRLFALSPDGRRLAFVGFGPDRRRVLWVRSLNALTAQPLAGTEDAISPFWSPDSRSIGFFAGLNKGTLKRIDVDGGPATTLCAFPGGPAGADWSPGGEILFATTGVGGGAIRRVSAAGGDASVMLAPNVGAGESDYWWPHFLPDGRRFLFLALGPGRSALGTYIGSLDSSDRTLVMKGGSNAKYANGRLLFLRENTLMAQRFDPTRVVLDGNPVPVAEQVLITAPTGAFSVSQSGVLAYARGGQDVGARLVWFDASGRELGQVGEPGSYGDVRLSPDGKRAAVTLIDATHRTRDIWLIDLDRDVPTRFTFDAGEDIAPLWSPDGQRIVFAAMRGATLDLYEKPSSGSGAETLLLSDATNKLPLSWSPDGRFILYSSNSVDAQDIWVLPLGGTPFPYLATPFSESPASFSPDGRWVAYSSNESGRIEVYVTAFPTPDGKWQVSTDGAVEPQWRHDGRQIAFRQPGGGLMAAPVSTDGQRVSVGRVRPLITGRSGGPRFTYSLAPDGRILANTARDSNESSTVTLVVNWPAGLP